MSLRIVIIGDGGREHALAWKLQQSQWVRRIFIAPGNAGVSRNNAYIRPYEHFQLSGTVETVRLYMYDKHALSDWILKNNIDFVIIGPDGPLAHGIVNHLSSCGIQCFGPTAGAALIESDKTWAKELMDELNIPTAAWRSFLTAEETKDFIRRNPEYSVVKAAFSVHGKGVVVAESVEVACLAVDKFLVKSDIENEQWVILEKRLYGEEFSVMAFTDGTTIKAMLPVQYYKRQQNSDEGPNTDGMGAYCPYNLSDDQKNYIENAILQKIINALADDGNPFIGVLQADLMITSRGIKVLEFNGRFGDPETQVLMPLLDVDLVEIIQACINGSLHQCDLRWKENMSCVGVVMASEDYPEATLIRREISGLSAVTNILGLHVFHAATAEETDHLVTAGGRVLNVVAVGDSLTKALAKAYAACREIHFEGCQYRTDIAYEGILRNLVQAAATYQSAGVDNSSGNQYIRDLKSIVESTFNENVVSSFGSYGAIVDVNFAEYSHPLLVPGCGGVGNKLKLAQECKHLSGIGSDLVAMCVNDILAHGAKPLFFLDYMAYGKLNRQKLGYITCRIISECRLAGLALIGGEIAELPGIYENDEHDLAGFAMGVVEKSKLLPSDQIAAGDLVIYLPSSGLHLSGFNLVRKIMADLELSYIDDAPFSVKGLTYAEEFLQPTTNYASDILPLVEQNKIKAFAPITSGGLLENVCRVIPQNLKVCLDAARWDILHVFAWLAVVGEISEPEMLRTFNCGIGGVVIVAPENADTVCKQIWRSNVIGEVMIRNEGAELMPGNEDYPEVEIINFAEKIRDLMAFYLPTLVQAYENAPAVKRVAVLISERGSSLEALINETRTDRMSAANIVLVITSRKNTHDDINYAIKHCIPNMVLERGAGDEALSYDYEDKLYDVLMDHKIEIVCLAGFLESLSEWFVGQWRGKMLNVHPSLLPSFRGTNAQRQALQAGVRVSGCTVFFVEARVNAGAIIEQASVPVYPKDTEATLAGRIKEQEHVIYPKALKLLAAEKIFLDLETGKVIWE